MYRRYGFFGLIKLCFSVLYTRLFFPQARIIRLPFDIRNRKNIKIGNKLTTGTGCRIEAIPLHKTNDIFIEIGDNVQINDYVHIGSVGSVYIGNNVLIASKVYISDHNHGSYDDYRSDSPVINPIDREPVVKPVVIEDNVWLGESVCVLPGVTIGFGTIIGANSVVTKDVPANCIAVGSPARVVKTYNYELNKWVVV